jgi:hypothetical protein
MKKLLIFIILIASLALSSATLSLRVFDSMTDVRVSSSKHFIYTYKSDISDMIPQIARIAEGVYDTLSILMQAKIYSKVNLIITDQSDMPNGFSSPLLNPVVNIYLANPDPTFIAKHEEWVEYVLTHELTHAFHLSSTRPSCLSFTRNSLFYAPNMAYPMYFLEGYTVYNESTIKRGRMKDTNYEAILRTMLIDSAIQPIGNASSYFNRFFPYSTLPYLYGPYIFDKYKEKYNSSISNLTRLDFCSLLPFSVLFPDLLMRASMGAYPSDVLKDVYKDVEDKTNKLKSSMIFNDRKKISDSGYDNSLPFVCNGKLYYIKSFPHRGKRLVENYKGAERELFRVTYSTNFVVRENKIYLDMLDVYDNTNMFFDIYQFDLNTNKLEALPFTRRGFGCDALGDTLLFIRNNFEEQRIIIYSLSKRAAIDSFTLDSEYKYYSISIKNFDEILLSCYRKGGFTDIALFNLSERTDSFMTSDIATDFKPQWSITRDGFYFISDREKINSVYFYDMDEKRIQKIYSSLYNVSSYSVDEEKGKIYVQDLSKDGDDIYESDIIEQVFLPVTMEELEQYTSIKNDNIKIKNQGKYIIPRFSGPGAYVFLPYILPATYFTDYLLSAGFPFIMLNSDVSQSLTFLLASSPNFYLMQDKDLGGFNYPTSLTITSSYFKNDISLSLDFQRDFTNFISSGIHKFLPNIYSISLSSDLSHIKALNSAYMTPSVSFEKTSFAVKKGINIETGISDYESSIMSITPSEGYKFSSTSYFAFVEDTSQKYDFGFKIGYTVYTSPAWNTNLFLDANIFYAYSEPIVTKSNVVPFNFSFSQQRLSLLASEDGFREESYIHDFTYIKAGVVIPLMFINSSIPVEPITSLPLRFDYISVSASQLAGFNFYERKRELASRISLNMCVNLSVFSIYPGIVLTFNEITKKMQFGATATIK